VIWSRGEVISDDALRISVLDRTFEHGLGLFESLRTWDGHPTLLRRHLDRMQNSAVALGLPLDPGDLPDAADVRRLREATGLEGAGDVRLRLTLSGGRPSAGSRGSGSILWMSAGPLPPPLSLAGARIERSILVDPDDPLARHKTLNYWRRRIEQERAAGEGADEVLCVTPDGLICEGTRSNIFLVRRDGELITPDPTGPMLDGVMRRAVIERARRLGVEVLEIPVPMNSIASAAEAFLTNSVRGMLPIARLMHAELPAPGPMTRRLWDHIVSWLETGGLEP
jgi:branched-subunit amino acid aminotransferase/4-amino-4-deoxychorismate lyase